MGHLIHQNLLQITGNILPPKEGGGGKEYENIIAEVLAWIGKKSSIEVTAQPNKKVFEVEEDGNRVEAVNLSLPSGQFWALEYRHPCTQINGRFWNTEICLAEQPSNKGCLFGLRLSTISEQAVIERPIPTIPAIIRQLGIHVDGRLIDDSPALLSADTSQDQLDDFLDYLEDSTRTTPIIIVTLPNQSKDIRQCLIDPFRLARMTQGIAKVYVLWPEITYKLSDKFGSRLSVYNGASRIYLPGFPNSEKEHPLFLPERYNNRPHVLESMIRRFAAIHSINHPNAENDLPRFIQIKSFYLDHISINQTKENGKDSVRLSIALNQLDVLKEQMDQALSLAAEEEASRKTAEKELEALRMELEGLKSAFSVKADPVVRILDKGIFPPLREVGEWGNACLNGRVLIHPRALRGAKKALYENPPLVYQGLILLSREYWEMKQGGEKLRDVFINEARRLGLDYAGSIDPVRAREYGDEYFVDVGRERFFLNMHLSRGNSKEERHCLRIYYAWDEDKNRVVVGHLPSHLTNRYT